MPIVFKKEGKDHLLGIWQSTEDFKVLQDLACLNQTEQQIWTGFGSDKRKREFLTVRALLNHLHPQPRLLIHYEANGKPRLENHLSLSISHTKEYVAVLLTERPFAGVDLETLRPTIERLSEKFANPEELSGLNKENKTEYLHVIWGAKEVLFKIYAKGEVDFQDHLHLSPFRYSETGEVDASIRMPDFQRNFRISYEKTGDRMLAWAVSS